MLITKKFKKCHNWIINYCVILWALYIFVPKIRLLYITLYSFVPLIHLQFFNTMKSQIKRFFSVIVLAAVSYAAAFAQCNNINITLTSTPSTCQANGTIGVIVTGTDALSLRMSDAQCSLDPIPPTAYSLPWATAAGGTLTDVPPGNYIVSFRAFCLTSGTWTQGQTAGTISVAGSYTVPNVYLGTIRKTLTCLPSGRIPIVVQYGRAPYTITMTNHPPAYTGATTATISALAGTPPSATFNFDDLPAGNYTFSVTDNCTYNTILNATVTTVSADFSPDFVYSWLMVPVSLGTTPPSDCHTVRIIIQHNPTGSGNPTHDAYDHYFNHGAQYYEVAFNESDTNPPTGGWVAPTENMHYTLLDDFNTFRARNGYVAVWVRIRGTNCISLLRVVGLNSLEPGVVVNYSNVTCTDFSVSHYPQYNSMYVFCFPYQWRITNGATVVVPWTQVTTTAAQVAHNIPFGSSIEYQDHSGQTWTVNLTSASPINNIRIQDGGNLCLSNSLPPSSNGIISNTIWINYDTGTIPSGTQIEYLSGPPGALPPNFPSIITETALANVYPYGAISYAAQSTPYYLTVPGIYTFRVTMPTCPAATYSIDPFFYYIVAPLSYAAIETCDGLQVYPMGQLGRIQGAASHSFTTWFSIDSAPDGVTVDRTAVGAGGSLLLPASGSYVIKMTYYQNTNLTNYCPSATLSINYTKQLLSLNAAVTSAYVCAGGTQGFIRVEGMNGSGTYTYELWSSDLATLHLSNSAGTFSYGSAGQTFIVRVRDNVCNTQFDQPVTILDLGTASIAYSGSTNNEVCVGGTIQLHCVTLGQTSYTWSGPNGWTSTLQNPVIPNATVAMSGTYTVTVTPENCGTPMSQSVVISVVPTPLPNVPNMVRARCQNTTPPTIAAITAASVTGSSYALRYYDSGGTITPTTTVPTSAATVLTYYVSQYNTTTGCESNRVTITIQIFALPDAPTVDPVSALCPGDPFTITVSPAIFSHRYTVYTWDGILLGMSADGSGVISGIIAPTSSTTYYVSATRTDIFCESASRTPVIITVNPRATTANITASGVSICSGTAATLTATSNLSAPVFNWYDSQTATAPLHTGATYIIGVTVTTTYYVGVSNATTCENALNNRYPVTVTITPTVIPSVTITAVPN